MASDGRSPVSLVFNLREVERSLKAFDKDLATRTRRLMAAESRKVRDEIRGDWKRGPAIGGHSYRAVTSGTKGLNPTLKLNRAYRPYVGWIVFGGRRPRDRVTRPRPPDGRWFYPGVKRARRRVVQQVRTVLRQSIRQAGLD
jgi:hypothetical protein